MGLFESAWSQVVCETRTGREKLLFALVCIPVGLLSAWLVFGFLSVALEGAKLRRIGGRAPRARDAGIFGLKFIQRSMKAMKTHKNLEFYGALLDGVAGHTLETRLLGTRMVITANVENIKAMLATQFGDFGKGEPFHRQWHQLLGDSIFTTDGPAWHASRQLLRPQFVRERVSDLQCFESHMDTLFLAMANGGALDGDGHVQGDGNGQRFDASDLFLRYTLDVTTEFLLGRDVKALSTPRQPFADAFAEVQRIQALISRAGPLDTLVRMALKPKFAVHMAVIDDFINGYIDEALSLSPAELASKGEAGYTFLHALAGFTRDRTVLHDQIMAVLLAGRDTTASALSFALYELARHPSSCATLRTEILGVVGLHNTPTYAHLKGMRYLQAVLSETLRLYPPVPFNVRLALRDTTLPRGGGPDGMSPVAVLKDTAVAYSTMVMQRRADLYPPSGPPSDVFAPDRWAKWQPRPWEYIPFNGGPRICIGQQFALTEMAYVLTRLFQRFDRVESHMFEIDGGSPSLGAEIVLQPSHGVIVSLHGPKDETLVTSS